MADASDRGRRYRAPREGWLYRLVWPTTSWLLTNLTVTLFAVLFFGLNRTTVLGREHVGRQRNTLLLSNHQSMIDSFLVGLAAFYPRSWIAPHLIPWNAAAEENFFRTPLHAWLFDQYRCIPIRQGRRDPYALRRMIAVLPRGILTLFPEGGRTRDGLVGPGRPGAGYLILSARPTVIPVAVDGMQDVLPIGSVVPRVFKRIYVSYGEAVDYSEFLDLPRNTDTAQGVVDKVMERIRAQHEELRRLRGIS